MTNPILCPEGVQLGVTVSSREEAVRLAGAQLRALDAVEPAYVDAMWEREQILSSYIGEGVAIPHGTDDSRVFVKKAQLAIQRFTEPIDWDGEEVIMTVAIASASDEHVQVLGALAEALLDEERKKILLTSGDVNEIVALLVEAFG